MLLRAEARNKLKKSLAETNRLAEKGGLEWEDVKHIARKIDDGMGRRARKLLKKLTEE